MATTVVCSVKHGEVNVAVHDFSPGTVCVGSRVTTQTASTVSTSAAPQTVQKLDAVAVEPSAAQK